VNVRVIVGVDEGAGVGVAPKKTSAPPGVNVTVGEFVGVLVGAGTKTQPVAQSAGTCLYVNAKQPLVTMQ